MAIKTRDDVTRNMLDRIRSIQESKVASDKKMLNEANEGGVKINSTAVAITDDPMWGQNVLTNQIQQFRSSVESGAQFTKPDECELSECPLIYIKDGGNLVFSGTIPCLNNLKWQFVLKTNSGRGCFIWADGLILSEENIPIINKLFGFYKNWREQWNSEAADLEKMVQNLENK